MRSCALASPQASQLEHADSLGFKLGIELGFMSTTSDRLVALKYGHDADVARGLNHVFEAEQVSWLSLRPFFTASCVLSRKT